MSETLDAISMDAASVACQLSLGGYRVTKPLVSQSAAVTIAHASASLGSDIPHARIIKFAQDTRYTEVDTNTCDRYDDRDDPEVTRMGAGESYRPLARRSPRRSRSRSLSRRDRDRSPPRMRARSPRDRPRSPYRNDSYHIRSPRRRSRTPPYRGRDRTPPRDNPNWRARDRRSPIRNRSPRTRTPSRARSPLRDRSPPRRFSPRRERPRSPPRRASPLRRDERQRSRSPYINRYAFCLSLDIVSDIV